MKFYRISERLEQVAEKELDNRSFPYVVTMTEEEWAKRNDFFGMEYDLELNPEEVLESKAVVNMNSLTGSFYIPDRKDICDTRYGISFALNQYGIVLIGHGEYFDGLIGKIVRTKKWHAPSLERFIYDFMEEIIEADLRLLEEKENILSAAEDEILKGETEEYPTEINDIRGELVDLKMHYGQLIDVAQEFEENENGYFKQENLRFFRLFCERVERLENRVDSLREYVVQLRDLVQAKLDEKQNHIMSLLTIVSTIFLPLTLIAGWYGMNFRYMPELNWKWAYPGVLVLCIAIVVGCLIYFKKKKWF